jgi:hypothetical protein
MMNLVQLQEQLKDFSPQQLAKEMQMPTGNVPQYLVLGELQRRKRMEASAMQEQAQQNQTTVAQDVVSAAGVPQGGIAGMAQALAPQTDMGQNTGQAPVPQMAGGGVIKAQEGVYLGTDRLTSVLETDPAVRVMANRMGMSVQEYIAQLDPSARASELQRVSRNRTEGAPSVSDVFDPNRPAYDQASPADLEETFGQLRNNLRDQEVFDMGVNPSYATDVRDRAVGMGISDIPMSAPAMDSAPSLAELSPFLGDRAAPELGMPELDPFREAFDSGLAQIDTTTPERRRYIPPTIGATELNLPKVRNALQPDAGAGLATGLRDAAAEATASDTPSAWDNFWSGVGSDIADTAAVLSPFASEEDKIAAAGNLGAMTTGEPLTVPDTGVESLLPPTPPAADTTTPTPTPTTTTQPGGGSGGSALGGSGAAVMSDLEKSLEQDKWLSLAKFGLALMSSQQPTLGGAIGEAGIAAVGDFQKAKQNFEETKLARATLAARRAGSSSRPYRIPAGVIGNLEDRLAAAQAEYAMLPEPTSSWFSSEVNDPVATERAALRSEISSLQAQISAAYGTHGLSGTSAPSLGNIRANISDPAAE